MIHTNRSTLLSVAMLGFGLAALLSSLAAEHPSVAEPRQLIKTVADAVLRDFPEPPPFDWGEGVLLSGMMRTHQVTGDGRYLQFVRRFADYWSAKGIGPLLAQKGYCGHWGPAFAMLELYEVTREPRHLALANEVIKFMQKKAERTRDGGLSHFNGKPQLWVDTLDMACPVLSHVARITGRPELQAEAVRQLEIFANRLQDPVTGLWYHMWDDATSKRTTTAWARGNGWAVMSIVETLKQESNASPAQRRLRSLLEKHLAALAPLQDKRTGLWHTVLDAPETYLETSASAMFLYGMAEARRLKLAQVPSDEILRKAWAGLAGKVDAEGRVIGVSGGTMPITKERYAAVVTGTYPWGTGAFLVAAAACDKGSL